MNLKYMIRALDRWLPFGVADAVRADFDALYRNMGLVEGVRTALKARRNAGLTGGSVPEQHDHLEFK